MQNELGRLLREARKAKGLTQTQVGDHIGVTYSAVGQWETGTIKNPAPERILAATDFLGIDRAVAEKLVAEMVGLRSSDGRVSANAQGMSLSHSVSPPPSSVAPAPDAPPFRLQVGRRDVPELGIAVGGEDGDFEVNGSDVLGYVPRPPALHGRDIFAVRVKNDSMSPRYYEGHLLYVERRREPSPGEDVIVELQPTEEGEPGRAFIKQLVSKGMASVVVKQFNPEREVTYDRREVKALYRVVPWNEAFGA